MKQQEKNKKIYVGLSGGVDSSVSAYILKQNKEDIIGAFIRTWQPDFIECTWRDERRDAIRVAAGLGIPFVDIDGENTYKEKVGEYMISEYKAGRTPNPDILCNREVKFGIFWQEIKRLDATHIATGHYAQNIYKDGEWQLHMSKDTEKDQTYFLWKLNQEDLEHILFPIGHLEKKEVRAIAEKADLHTAAKKDSQGVCMLGKLDMKDFLKNFIEEKPGDVITIDGTKIGTHDGVYFFTIGERHGFFVEGSYGEKGPWYVVSKDIKNNILVVHNQINQNPNALDSLKIDTVNWIPKQLPNIGDTIFVRTRYREPLIEAHIIDMNKSVWIIKLPTPHTTASSGQSLVMYKGTQCLGGGVII